MRCFRARHTALTLCRRCSLSTSCAPQASAIRIDTHSTSSVSVGCPVDSPLQSTTRSIEPQTWFAYSPPSIAPLPPAPAKIPVAGKPQVLELDMPLVLSTGVSNGVPEGTILFSSTKARNEKDTDPVSERTLNLGKTIDILKDRLPTLLQSPLPSEILSPSITLQLFPSTHPHLPSVRGRMAYIAALWTSPVVWGRIPGIKVRLEILSIKMVKGGGRMSVEDESLEDDCEIGGEQMIVKWRASSSPNGNGDAAESTATHSTSNTPSPQTNGHLKKDDPLSAVANSLPKFTITGDFCGLFIFEFDDKGRIKTHIIEDVEEDRDEAKQQHSKVITLTEWLLKKAKGSLEDKPQVPGLAFERIWQDCRSRRRRSFS